MSTVSQSPASVNGHGTRDHAGGVKIDTPPPAGQILTAATALLDRGYKPVIIYPPGVDRPAHGPTNGKEPFGKAWGVRDVTPLLLAADVKHFERMGKTPGIGICLGPGRAPGGGWLVDIEEDGPQAFESRIRLFAGEEPATVTWGSQRGGHSLWIADPARMEAIAKASKRFLVKKENQPGVFKFPSLPDLELRIGGYKPDGTVKQLQSVVPPTPGADGRPRSWGDARQIEPLPDSVYETLLTAIAESEPKPLPPAVPPVSRTISTSPHDAYVRIAVDNECNEVAATTEGGRNNALNNSALALGGLVHLGVFGRSEIEARLLDAATRCDLPQGEAIATIRSGMAAGEAQPRVVPKGNNKTPLSAYVPPGDTQSKEGHADSLDYGSLSDEELGLVFASSIEPELVEWLWKNRVAKGKLNLWAGDGGSGKSQTAILIAAAVSNGGPLPDGSGLAPLGKVIILAAEDGARDTIVPRLMAAGAKLSNVIIHTAKVTFKDAKGRTLINYLSFQDLGWWGEILRRSQAVLLIADPIPAYLGRGVNDHKNNDVRAILEPFVEMLDGCGAAMLGVTHLNKSTDHRTPVNKILGSVAYSNLARTVHCTYRDPDDKERFLLCLPKGNLTAPQPTLAYRIKAHSFEHNGRTFETSRVEFDPDPVDLDAAEIMEAERTPGGRQRGPSPVKSTAAAEWLWDYLNVIMPDATAQLAEIIRAAGEAGMIGKLGSDNKWSGLTSLYNAKDKIPQLDGAREGTKIVQTMKSTGFGNRDYKHWTLQEVEK